MKAWIKYLVGFGIGLSLSHFGFAGDRVENFLITQLQKRYPGARIEFLSGSSFPSGRENLEIQRLSVLSESGSGTVDYSVVYTDGTQALGQARFAAFFSTPVAVRRIRPGEKLGKNDFTVQDVNVAQGLAYQYRGVMFKSADKLEGLQARQTILEGQYPLTSGVEKVPDLRRGDTVEVKVIYGNVQLSTMGQVQEPGYRNENVRVLTQKTKKELVGKLSEQGWVEVRL